MSASQGSISFTPPDDGPSHVQGVTNGLASPQTTLSYGLQLEERSDQAATKTYNEHDETEHVCDVNHRRLAAVMGHAIMG
jgi:hypothetical protein